MEDKVRVRFAPSPTGYLHIGSARTALFNWVFAKRHNAEFILRIEDTDTKRSRDEFLKEIISSLQWLGINANKIYYQSRRLNLYREYADKLIEQNKAFNDNGAVLFRYEFDKVEFEDLIRGHIEFSELPKDTEVIIKSDGTPTYNFSCVIDDALLGITHVIRGEDHIPNTPKQILLYQTLGFKIPYFAHLPMILSSEGGKMSKRFGATSIREYKNEGYLPEAIVNYLLLLGWSPGGNREIIYLDEAARLFDIKNVNKTSAAFSVDKLNWVNSEYIKGMEIDKLAKYAKAYLESTNFLSQEVSFDYLKEVIKLLQPHRTGLYLEVKIDPDREEVRGRLVKAIYDVLRLHSFGRRAFLASFDREVLKISRELDPGISTGLIFREPDTWRELLADGFSGVDIACARWNIITASLIRRLREEKKKVFAWTIKSEKQLRSVASLGVDGLAANDPAWLRGKLGSSPILRDET